MGPPQVVREWHMPADKILTVQQAEAAAKANPQDAKAQADPAVAYVAGRKLKEAEQAAREALAINPDNTAALEVLAPPWRPNPARRQPPPPRPSRPATPRPPTRAMSRLTRYGPRPSRI